MRQSFTTEFGDEIPFLPGYFERNNFYAYYLKDIEFCDKQSPKTGTSDIQGLVKRYVAFSAMVEFLSQINIPLGWKRGIDLGGAEGLTARLFKSAGFIEHATNLDLETYPNFSDDVCRRFLRHVVMSDSPLDTELDRTASRTRNAQQHALGQSGLAGLFRAFPNDPTIDQSLQANIFEHEAEYDFVTSNQFLQYFDPEKILPRIRRIMKTGGLMVGFLDCWWFPITSAGIVGHFPCSVQRLSRLDAERYWSEFHPDLAASFSRKYSYIHPGGLRPTASDWIELSARHGFQAIAVQRVVPQEHPHVREAPAAIFSNPLFDERGTLRDMRRLNPRVEKDDLFTAYFRLAFRAV